MLSSYESRNLWHNVNKFMCKRGSEPKLKKWALGPILQNH